MKRIQDMPQWRGDNRYSLRFDCLDVERQITVLLDVFGDTHLHKQKIVSDLTKKKRAYTIFQFVNDVHESGLHIRNLLNIDQRHITAAVNVWKEKKAAASTIQTTFSILRWLTKTLGKSGLIKPIEFYGLSHDDVKRSYVATKDKSWSSNGVIPKEKIEEARQRDKWVGIQLEMMNEFGLRVTESILIKPNMSDSGTLLRVFEGAKNGLARNVPIRSESQRETLNKAIEMSKQTDRNSLVPPGKRPAQARCRLYYICRKVGITKTITPHGLRHEFANDLYQEISGVPSVVRGGSTILNDAKDIEARHAVTKALGHSRLGITAAYTGPRKIGRPKNMPNQL